MQDDAPPNVRRWYDTLPLLGVLLAVLLIGLVAWKRTQPIPIRLRPAQIGDIADGDVVALRLAVEADAEVAPGAPLRITFLVENPGSVALKDVVLDVAPPNGARIAAESVRATWPLLAAGTTVAHEVAVAFEKAGAAEVAGVVADGGGGARATAIVRIDVKPGATVDASLAPVLERSLLAVTRGSLDVHDDAPFELTVVVESMSSPLDGVRLDVIAGEDLEGLDGATQPRLLPPIEPGRRWFATMRFLPRREGRHTIQVLASTEDGDVRAVGVHALRVRRAK